ncbi:FYVE, RhoGEF and PH domain-containing protein 5 [Triplophysa dalaica]|uniref:FYVE, RhoGEF and PH domain-containing protein 5 n=1 Tax=Triplophysa dalaica TaxID=1582913 RepID=UPI0024DFBD2D|nr:FYVE, RhoGEF and PH domain-containing protein 5 [Triplophysa dalaica]
MSAEFQECALGTRAHYQAKRLFKGKCLLPMPEKCCDKADLKPKNLPQHHHSVNLSVMLGQPKKSPRQHMTETHRKIILDQWGPQERKDLKTKHFLHTEKSIQRDETEQDVVLDQVDELGCGDELAQGIDLDLVEGLEENKSEEESTVLHSDSCYKRETDYNEVAEQMQVDQRAWGWTENSVLTSYKRSSDAHLAPNGISKQITGMLTGILFNDNIRVDKTSLDGFYPNQIYTNGMFSHEDTDEMFPDICDAGEALADKDGLSECDLFDHMDPLLVTETAKNVGDVIAISIEEGSDSSVLSSSSIEEDDDEVQQEIEKMDEQGNHLSDISSSRYLEGDRLSVSSSQTSDTVPDANEKCCSNDEVEQNYALNEQATLSLAADCDLKVTLNPDLNSILSLVQQLPETNHQTLTQNKAEDNIMQEEGVIKNRDTKELDQTVITVEDLYEETEPIMQAKGFLQNRKYFMTRSISVETPSKNLDLSSIPASGNGRLLLHPRSFYTDHCFIGDSRPALTGSLGCLSQRFHTSANVDKMSKLDIPPPFELASITKRPIRKSSPSLSSEILATCKKPDFGLKRYLLPLRFLRKSDRKSPIDNRSISSRSSSESSPQGSCKRLDFIRHNMGSPELHRAPDCTSPMSPSSFVFHKNRQKTGLNLMLHKDLASSTTSIGPDNMFHPLFEPVPFSKPRSFSSPDSSEYENVTNTSSHYENVQIRLLNPVIQSQRNQGSSSDTDGYVDMSSLTSYQSKSQSSEQETDSTYTFCSPNVRPDGTVGVSVGVACTQEKTKTLDKMTISCSRAFYNAKELLDSEAQHVGALQLLFETVKADERLMKVWTEIPDIYSLHQNIHTLLETHMKEWHQNEGIAEIILAKKTEFYLFSSFISNYDEKLNYVEHIKSTLSDAMSLKKQLLVVIVRILQYRMLLTDYVNNLSPDSKQYQDTQDALVVVSDIAYQVNDSLKNGADLLRLVNIEHSVLGLTDLIQPGRVFVKEGTLMKVSRKCKQPRHLFLMNDLMLYTYPQQDGKYRLINTLPLTGMEVGKPPIENALKIAVKDISITLSAGSCVERDGWFATLNRTFVDLGPVSGGPVGCLELLEGQEMCLGENAPPLLSVSQVTACMNCPSHFSLTNRRHHCHACGKVVCKDCCRNKFPLKYMKNRRAKVCDYCYTELCKNDVVTVVEGTNRPLSAMFQNIHPSSLWRSRKGQMSFNQVTGADGVMSGTLQRYKNSKRSWRSLWFLLKDKVLYTYPQPEERLACETLPLLGFSVRSEVEGESSVFQLYHKSTLFYTFRAQDSHTAQRWVDAMEEATVL